MASASDPKHFSEVHGVVDCDKTMEDEYLSLMRNSRWHCRQV